MDPRKINIKNVRLSNDCWRLSKTVENSVKYDKKLINWETEKSTKMVKVDKTRILPKMASGAVYTL